MRQTTQFRQTRRWSRASWATALTLTMIAGGLTSACHIPQLITPAPASSAPPERYTGLKSTCPILTSEAAKNFRASGEGQLTDDLRDLVGSTQTSCWWGPDFARRSPRTRILIFENNVLGAAKDRAQQHFNQQRTGYLDRERDVELPYGREITLVLDDFETEWGPARITVSSDHFSWPDLYYAFEEKSDLNYVLQGILDRPHPRYIAITATQTTLTENAVIRVTLRAIERYPEDEKAVLDNFVRRHRESLQLLTADVIANLR